MITDVIGASPVGAAPTTSSFSTYRIPGFSGLSKYHCKRRLKFLDLVHFILEVSQYNSLSKFIIRVDTFINEHANQSGTKTNLVAQILATNFGVFFVLYVMFSKICSMWV